MDLAKSGIEAEQGDPGYKWRVLVSVIAGTFMVILDATAINVAIPTLQAAFGVNGQKAAVDQIDAVITAYSLALGVVTPLAGFLGERLGVKRVYLFALGVFGAGSLLCSFAPSLTWLIVFRVIQGAGGGALVPLGTAMLTGAFTEKQRGIAFGLFGIAMVMAPALGPILGGYFVEYWSWHYIFYINVPVCIAGIVMGSLWLKEYRRGALARFDFPGIALSSVSFGLLLYAIQQGSHEGWTALSVIISLVAGVVLFACFIVVELRVPEPLLDLRLFRKRTFSSASVVGWVSTIALFGSEFLLPIYLQSLRGLSPLQAGLLLLPLAVAAGIVAPFSGALYNRIGPRWLIVGGSLLLAINTWNIANVALDTPYWFLMILFALRGIAVGLAHQTTINAAYTGLQPQQLPRASSLITSFRNVFQSFGVAVLGTIVTHQTDVYVSAAKSDMQHPATALGKEVVQQATLLFQQMTAKMPHLPPEALQKMHEKATAAATGKVLGTHMPHYLLQAINDAYWLTFWLSIATILLALTLPGAKKREAAKNPSTELRETVS
uniref:MFS transporter n=1 Tax=Thermosporothrix sp. COM3 TaxID=2490863 RepID=A0A455SS24_9CHLR|nr:MFS transporter [Thermosporothrix sp. COM3]